MITAPANSLMNGVAQVTVDHRTVLQLCYEYGQHQTFLQAMGYANEQINQLSANTKKYKFLLQAENGGKVEVYEDYLVVFCTDSGIMTTLKLVKQSTNPIRSIMLSDLLTVQYAAPTNEVPGSICFLDGEYPQPCPQNTVTVSLSNAGTAQSIANYIQEAKKSDAPVSAVADLPHMTHESVTGTARTFTLEGATLNITAEFDISNTYRKNFCRLASACADRFKQQYQIKVHDFWTFMHEFPAIYDENMEPLLQYAMDALVSEGIWSVTKESFTEGHKERYHGVPDDYNTICDAANQTVDNNRQYVATATNVPRITRAGGFGFANAMKAINKAQAYNTIADLVSKTTQNNTSINSAQQWELYNRIDLENLTLRVYCDYLNIWVTLVAELIKNGKKLAFRMKADNGNYKNIFQNISNPSFPQDKVAPVLLEIIQAIPFRKEYYVFMNTHFGETEEVKAICEYFGYGDLNDPRTL